MKKILFTIVVSIFIVGIISGQTFKGLDWVKKFAEYEGQRFLMEDVLDLSSSEFEKFRIDKTIRENDKDEEFYFILTSYTFREKSGLIITSASYSMKNNIYSYVNVHLTDAEFRRLYSSFEDIYLKLLYEEEHYIKIFNDRIILDAERDNYYAFYTIWIDNNNRHSFTQSKWKKAFKRYNKFLEKK